MLLGAVPAAVQAQAGDSYDYSINAGGASITITDYTGPGGAVTIPTNINGLTVTTVGDGQDRVFFATQATNVTIADSVTNIADFAFQQSEVISVTIPDSVTSIGNDAFDQCLSLSSVPIPSSVTSVGNDAFDQCSSLSKVTIPDSVTSLGSDAFYDCSSLTNVTIGNGVTSLVGVFAACARLASVTIGTNVISIGTDAFSGCSSLTNATIPSSVTTIGLQAFEGTRLASVTIPNNVTSIGDYAFEQCEFVTSLTIGNGVTNIGDYAFEECGALPGVAIPNSVTAIGDYAFFGTALTNVEIGDGVNTIGDSAFGRTPGLIAITVDPANSFYSSVSGILFGQDEPTLIEYPLGKAGNSYAIPNGVTSIAANAFFGAALTNITMPNSLTSIGASAFGQCPTLTTRTIPNGVTFIGDYAFDQCRNLTSMYFEGNSPIIPISPYSIFTYDNDVAIYYLLGTTGWGTNFSGLPTTLLNSIALTANPNNGMVPLTVSFSSAATDSAGNAISNWNWIFGDGSTGTGQNPSHTYTAAGNFSVTLIETNNNGLLMAGAGTSIDAEPNSGLVSNGDFETGDFTGWTLSGDTSYTSVDDGTGSGITPYSGNYEAALGTSGSWGYLSQTLSTTAGATYLLSFWLENPYGDIGEFVVSWNGNTLFDTSAFLATDWTNAQFSVSATGTDTVLQFAFEGYYGYLVLDDISVVPTHPAALPSIASLNLSGANLVFNVINGQSGGTYTVLMSANLASPLSLWTPVATNVVSASGNFSITATNALNRNVPQAFYILQSQ